jgi:hypothetical protein
VLLVDDNLSKISNPTRSINDHDSKIRSLTDQLLPYQKAFCFTMPSGEDVDLSNRESTSLEIRLRSIPLWAGMSVYLAVPPMANVLYHCQTPIESPGVTLLLSEH